MALYENVTYNAGGKIAENDLMQYKIPTRQDVGHINVEFETTPEKILMGMVDPNWHEKDL